MTDTNKAFNNACLVLWLLHCRLDDLSDNMDAVSMAVRRVEGWPVFSFAWHVDRGAAKESFHGHVCVTAETLAECDPSELSREIGDSWLAERTHGAKKWIS